jgi:hypothetical protein
MSHATTVFGIAKTIAIQLALIGLFVAIMAAPFVWALRTYGWRRGWWRGLLWGFLIYVTLGMVVTILSNIAGYAPW